MTKMKLHDYQERAVQFILEKKAVYLAVDLGMGKTAIALETIKRTGQRAFVFGPLRTITTSWPEEIKKWAPELSYYICHGPDKSIMGLENCDIILMNYEGLKWLSQQTGRWTKRMVVFDESSMVKSHSTQRFKLLQKMWNFWSEYKLCLSATPAPNSLLELWSQYYLLDRGDSLGKNISSFRRDYCTSYSFPGMSVTLYKVDPRFVNEIYTRCEPRTFRLEASDYLDLPDITYNKIKCELPAKVMRKYKELEKDFFIELENGTAIEAPSAATVSGKLRQIVQGGIYDEDKVWQTLHRVKLDVLKELMDTSSGQPILCPIQFKGELAALRDAFGSDVPLIAGGTSVQAAKHYIDTWNKGDLPLLLCHPASISHGVNLQAGGHIILWYGLTWSLEQYLQLNGRLHRQGQENAVFIHHLVMKDTIDEPVMKALANKESLQKHFLDYMKEKH